MPDIPKIPSSEVTSEGAYLNRRALMQAGILAAGVVAVGGAYRLLNPRAATVVETDSKADAAEFGEVTPAVAMIDGKPTGFAVGEPRTSYQSITTYNNYYEFTTNKDAVAAAAAKFVTTGWTVSVGGMVAKPKTFDMDDLKKVSPLEERVYRMRCVEAWSMVIPWAGYSLSKLLNVVEPLSSAKYVAFETLVDRKRMPGLDDAGLAWPYVEGLRMDEAMHPLTLLARGIYGRKLPAQNGAPIRLVTPWKYGFKGIKSIIKITLTDKQPPTTWSRSGPHEYGFYANVNPNVPHPRWSQAQERRIEGASDKPTLMFNGYGEQVASLYAGMDLSVNF